MAAHSISFLAGLRFLYADIPQQKSSLRATFFLYTKKEGKDVPRGSHLEHPGGLPTFFSGKSAGGRTPEPAHTMRGLGAPGAGLGAGLKKRRDPNPRGRSPLCIVGFYDNGGEVLLKREPTGSPGVRGNPGGVFASFCRRGQKEVAAHWTVFLPELRSLCADKP